MDRFSALIRKQKALLYPEGSLASMSKTTGIGMAQNPLEQVVNKVNKVLPIAESLFPGYSLSFILTMPQVILFMQKML
jgi:hypothetical protein